MMFCWTSRANGAEVILMRSAGARCIARQLRLRRALGGGSGDQAAAAKDTQMPRAKKIPSPIAPDAAVTVTPVTAEAPPTKSTTVLAYLQRERGATLAELVAATGWQPHTTRAMLTGLRKKGHAIERRQRDGVSCYHLPVTDA
jgi:hypothetical protein